MGRRFLLTTWGSFGDLHPYLAVAIGLRQRGHEVTIATSEIYRQKIESEGVGFHAVRPDLAPLQNNQEALRRAMDLRTGTEYVVRQLVLPYIEQSYEDLFAAARGRDVLVAHPLQYALPLVAEKLRIPWLSVALQPLSFLSVYDPPVLPRAPKLHRIRRYGRWPYALLFGFMKRRSRSWAKPVDRLRARLGLAPATGHPLIEGAFSPYGTLAWFSRLFARPQPDWPPHTRITGFPFYDRQQAGESLDPSLAEFLRSGEPPVVFTLGTSAVMDAGDFFKHSLRAAIGMGRRAVLLVGPQARNLGRLPDTVFVADYAPYSDLLPHAAATVHQAGIGTTAQALRAGRPMLAVPFSHDQPDNAERVSNLGVARILYRNCYTAERAQAELCELLSGPYANRAAELGREIRTEDGVGTACAMLEQLAADV